MQARLFHLRHKYMWAWKMLSLINAIQTPVISVRDASLRGKEAPHTELEAWESEKGSPCAFSSFLERDTCQSGSGLLNLWERSGENLWRRKPEKDRERETETI